MSVAATASPQRVGRPTGLRLRADLIIVAQQFGPSRYWVVKDPVALRYFHLREEEFALLEMLADGVSLEEMIRRFERQFAPRHLSSARLHAFLARAHGDGLVVADGAGQETQLLRRRSQRQRRRLAWSWTRLLAIQFRGIDPDRWLGSVAAVFRPVFTWWFQSWALLLAVAACVLAAARYEKITARLPSFEAFFASDQIVWFFVVLAGVKVLHELGHAIACKHFGGECHEIGAMLLVFTPCLYCNVSDSWLLPNKWRRIAIAAAGMWVELMLAVAAVFVWYFSRPGLLHVLALQTVFVCGVGTLLVNGNPLLRYDGYYIFADLVEMPNLAERSRALLSRIGLRLCLGISRPGDRAVEDRHPAWLIVYGLASMAYRLFVLVLIVWFLWKVLTVVRLQSLAMALTLVVALTIVAPALIGAVRLAQNPVERRSIRKGRVLATLVGLALLAIGIASVPLPYYVQAPIVVEAKDAARVYASVPGILVRTIEAGAPVAAGDMLGKLENDLVATKIVQLEGRLAGQQLHLENLKLRRGDDAEAESQIPTAESALADIAAQLAERRREQARLTLVAPQAGTVLPPPQAEIRSPTASEQPDWKGTPLEPRNLGAYLPAGTLFCSVGDPDRVEVILLVDQGDVDRIARDQPVELWIDQRPGELFEGTVSEVAAVDLQVMPRELIGRRDILTETDETGVSRPVETLYRVRVALVGNIPRLTLGARGTARITAGQRTIGQRVTRYLQRTFRFDL